MLVQLIQVLSFIAYASQKLLYVMEHFRHGARGPCDGLDENGDDYLKIHWETLGELSPMGMRMHYLLGVRNRERYDSILSKTFDPREIYIVSTDLNRTIHSAYTQLSGLYPMTFVPTITDSQTKEALPPNEINEIMQKSIDELGNKAVPHQTFPLHIFHISEHAFLLHEPGSDCEPIKEIREQNKQKEKVKKATIDFHNDFGKEITEYLGKPSNISTQNYSWVNYFCDHFIADTTEGKNLSALKANLTALTERCHWLLELQLYEVVLGDKDNRVARMSMTPIMKRIISQMKGRIGLDQRGKSDKISYTNPKFFMLSGHDTSVGAMMVFMKEVFKTPLVNPKYAANLYFELHRNESLSTNTTKDYYLMYYMNDELIKQFDFDYFVEECEKNFWTDQEIKEFCNFKLGEISPESNNYLLLSVVLGIVCLILSVLLIIFGIKSCSISKKLHSPMISERSEEHQGTIKTDKEEKEALGL